MEDKECDNCFSDITLKVDQLLNVAKNAIVNMNHAHNVSLEEREKQSKDFFRSQEEKHDKYLDKQDRRENLKLVLNGILITILSAVIGFSYLEQNKIKDELDLKANKNEVLRIDDAQKIRELGDKYYDARYLIRNGSEPDPVNYKQFVETLFERASRSGQINENTNN